ncbi:hypothetical protein FOCC_FOCC015042 [Frankliniella occidentalis]|nr:hypothetical protein FOCC_FOCC015042 [Frankliniella occidentalis]
MTIGIPGSPWGVDDWSWGGKVHKELVFRPPIEALDQDVAIDAAVRYDIIAGNERRLFRLDPRNGSLFLERELDLDAERTLPGNTFSLTVQAAQVDNPLKAGVARVEVELLDINDNLPEFEVDLYNISIVENLPNGFSVLQVMATDKDQGDNAFFTYQLEDPLQAFNIDARTGWLTVRDQGRLDREKQPTLTMHVRAKEKTPSVVRGATGDENSSSVNVTVTLLDANDNNPSFVPSNLYEFTAYNDAAVGDVIGQVKAVDPDLGRNGMVLYDVQRTGNLSSTALPFVVDAQTGEVSVADAPLSPGRHALFVEASDQPANPSERRFSLAVISVDVLKAGRRDGSQGEQVPDFVGAPYEFWVGSNVAIGTSVGQIRVTDSPDSRKVLYDLLHSYHEGVPFAVEERSGTITVVADMRKFERTLYDFEAVATDSRDMVLVTNVTIHVVHPEDEVATLFKGANGAARRPMEFRVRENLAGALVGQLLAPGRNVTGLNVTDTKAATGPASKLRFVIANQQDVAEREAKNTSFTAPSRAGRGQHLLPVVSVPESVAVGTPLVRLLAEDRDTGSNAAVTYALVSEAQVPGEAAPLAPAHGHFKLAPSTGEIQVTRTLPPESEFHLNVTATDGGGLSDSVLVKIYVRDVNDHAPAFVRSWYTFDLAEGVYTNHVLGRLEAVDADFGANANISYYIMQMQTYDDYSTLPFHINELDGTLTGNGNGLVLYDIPRRQDREDFFNVDSKEGVVTTSAKLDFETQGTHNVTLVARDLGIPSLSATALLVVSVVDVPETLEDSLGPMFLHRYYEVEVEENCAVPIALLALNVTEAYRGFSLRYSLVPNKRAARGLAPSPASSAAPAASQRRASVLSTTAASMPPAMFRVDPRNGTLVLTESPDRELRSRYEVTVRVDVYVLDEEKQLVMLMAARPVDVETSMENITTILSNVTGMDVRVRKLQPRIDDSFYSPATDLYLYAVDPVMNAELRRRLPSLRGVDLVGGGLEVSRAEAHALSALEVGVVVLGCVVFLGALTAAVCVGCVRRFRHRKGGKGKDKLGGFAHQTPLTLHHKGPGGLYPGTTPSFFSLTANTSLGPPGMPQGLPPHPGPALSSVGGGGDTTDTYVEMHSNKSSNCNKRRYPTSQRTRASRSASAHHRHQHEPTCTRHRRHRHQRRPSNAQGLHMARSNSNAGFDVGLGSSADSGQILFEERDRELGCCPCGHSPSHSSAESSNGSYEDSLKSSRRPCGMSHANTATVSRTRHRQREAPQMIGSMGTPLTRRQSERVIMCPMQS